MMRKLLISSFLLLIVGSLLLSIISVINKEWESLTASLSVMIAIISGWIAYEAFYRQNLSGRAQVLLRIDCTSRYNLIQLVAENLGSKPAFNIELNWNQKLLNHEGEEITFNKYDDTIEIPVLNANERASVLIDAASEFYKKNKDKNLDYSGEIVFQESLNSKKKTSYPFQFSLKQYGGSLAFESEEPKTMFELQKIPKKLDEIAVELKNIENILNKKPNV